jgi:hypothetical protein
MPLSSAAHLDNNHHDLEACDFHPFAKSLEQCMISSSSLQAKSYAFDVSPVFFSDAVHQRTVLRAIHVGYLREQSLVLACPLALSFYTVSIMA